MGFLTHLRQQQIDTVTSAVSRQDSILDEYLDWLGEDTERSPEELKLTIIARSAVSPAVTALIARAGALRARQVTASVIVSQPEPKDAFADLEMTLAMLNAGTDTTESVRWAKRSALLDAHEQITMGTHMCWSGDAMRREPGKRDSLDLLEHDAPHTVRLGLLAFDAIWSVSEPVTASKKTKAPSRKPLASQARPANTIMPSSSLMTRLSRLAATWH